MAQDLCWGHCEGEDHREVLEWEKERECRGKVSEEERGGDVTECVFERGLKGAFEGDFRERLLEGEYLPYAKVFKSLSPSQSSIPAIPFGTTTTLLSIPPPPFTSLVEPPLRVPLPVSLVWKEKNDSDRDKGGWGWG